MEIDLTENWAGIAEIGMPIPAWRATTPKSP